MKVFSIILVGLFIVLVNCKQEKETNFNRFHLMKMNQLTDKLYNPSKKASIPFTYNQIYDPYLTLKSSKSVYQAGKINELKLHVIDSTSSSMNVGGRKRRENIVKAYSVLIENISDIDTMHLPLHRGGALLIQEIKNKHNEWKPIESERDERIGLFYYKIFPKEYVYTKIPIYKGKTKAPFRVKLKLNDSTSIFSEEFESTVKRSWLH